ncbi:MAG: TetR/AcrR family transcriptional regulator C-terminal domain-containing protein [Propionicimonas sp.]|nr:TetR/AcrR family transcriptional regulator C-terminal domain-containing protein [Propionicimonas sp.]
MQERLQEGLDLAQDEPRAALRATCRSLATIIVTPRIAELRRLISSEAGRFPDLAAEWYALGPGQTVDRLAAWLPSLRPHLSLPDPQVAAEQLLWLVVAAPLNSLLFLPPGTAVDQTELRQRADVAAEMFWRAHASTEE